MTERKKMEQQLRRLSDAVRMSTDSIVVTDLEGNLLDANEASLKLYGVHNKPDSMGLGPLHSVIPEEREMVSANLAKVIERGTLKDVQHHALTRDGRKLLIETSASLMRSANWEPIGLVAVSRDITERKRMEEQLYRAGRLAAVGELAAGVAHELNNPLAAIKSLA